MALDQIWILVFIIPTIIVITVITGFLLKTKPRKKHVVMVSNTNKLVTSPFYQKAIKQYRLGIITTTALLTVTIILLSIIAAKPVNISTETITKYNRDIVLCLDVSGSMAEVNKEIIQKFEEMSDQFKGERISLVVWNSSSHMVFPLTDDYGYVKDNLEKIKYYFDYYSNANMIASGPEPEYDLNRYTSDGKGGSLIGDGVTACSLAFGEIDPTEDRSRTIILATDNVVNGTPIITLEEAIQYTTEQNITVYGIRPITGYEVGNEASQMKETIETINQGKYYELTDPIFTKEIVDSINSEEATAMEGGTETTKTDNTTVWIIFVSVFGVISLLLLRRFKI